MMLIKFQMMKIAVVKRFQEGRKYVGTTIEGTASMEMQNVATSILRQSAKNILILDSAEKKDAMKDIPSNVN